jgi:hypothetical protein
MRMGDSIVFRLRQPTQPMAQGDESLVFSGIESVISDAYLKP